VDSLSYKTVSANEVTVTKEWVVIDAENEILGRLASKVAKLLRGKYKTNYTPFVDCGDNVIVINAEKVRFTGKKWTDKIYTHYTGYPGGQRDIVAAQVLAKHPIRIVEMAVRGMLPKNRLGRAIYRNLHVVEGAAHKFEAQKPKTIKLTDLK